MEDFKTTHSSLLKSINRTLIKECFENGTACSKQMAAELAQTSFPTASRIIDDMVRSGELAEAGQNVSSGGRRAALYVLNPEYEYTLSVTVFYKKIHCSLHNALGKNCKQIQYSVENEAYLPVIFDSIRTLLPLYPITVIMAGIPGCVADGKILSIDMYDSLKNVHLKAQIEDTFHIPTIVENDVNAAALGYYTQIKGQTAATETTACVYVSENGPGCGLILHGEIIHGFSGFAGELGYMLYDDERTFQHITIQQFKNIDKTQYLLKLTAAIVSFINPQRIVFYKNDVISALPEQFEHLCRKNIPEYAMPEIVLSEDFIAQYELGLRMLAKNVSRETFYQLLQRKP